MVFDSRKFLEAMRPPEFTAKNGDVFVGRILSIEEWQPYEVRMQKAAAGAMQWPEMRALLRDLTIEFFPRGWRFWTLRFWRPCWYWVDKLPPVLQLRAVYSFMHSQADALGLEMPTLGTKMQKLLGLDANADSPSAG